jgi:hypothetical protein
MLTVMLNPVDSAENILQAPLELKGCAVAYLFFTI